MKGEIRAFDVGAGDVEARAGHGARVDLPLDGEIGERRDAAGGARGGYAGGEVEAREAVGLRDEEALVARGEADDGARGPEQVLVHADEAGDDGLAAQVEDARALRDRDVGRRRR